MLTGPTVANRPLRSQPRGECKNTSFSTAIGDEFEMAVKTRNEDGLAREVDPDKVLRRLDGILRTVKILPEESPAATEAEGSTEDSEPASHN